MGNGRAGALGVIFGRNVWQRQYEESLRSDDQPPSAPEPCR